jgi:hypothetical protein
MRPESSINGRCIGSKDDLSLEPEEGIQNEGSEDPDCGQVALDT